MMSKVCESCFICGKHFGGDVVAHSVAGAPPGYNIMVDTPCYDRIVQIETDEDCTQLEAMLALSSRIQGFLLGKQVQEEAHHA